MKKIFVHNAIFRIVTPAILGTVVYILILLIFDSISSLQDNFLSLELAFSVVLAYLVLEFLRLTIVLLDKWFVLAEKEIWRIVTQMLLGVIISWIVVYASMISYFKWVLDLSSFGTEYEVFSTIYIFGSLLYNLLHIGLSYLQIQNESKLKEEEIKKDNLDFKIQAFHNEVKPEFLYESLETLILLLHEDELECERYLDKLSTIYRYVLSNKKNELVSIHKETEILQVLVDLLNEKYHHIRLNNHIQSDSMMVPGTLNLIIENFVNQSLISSKLPLQIDLELEDDEYLMIKANNNEKLSASTSNYLENIQRTYDYFSLLPIIELKAYEHRFVKIPLIQTAHAHELENIN